jgi:hypothetical protein
MRLSRVVASSAAVLLALCLIVSSHHDDGSLSPSLFVRAKECRIDATSTVWKHAKGSFKKTRGTNEWVEYNENGEAGAKFVHQMTEGSSIVVLDKDRDVSVLLRDDLAGIRNNKNGEHQFQQLYQGSWVKTVDCT